jgi:hypothetical protein
LPDQGCLRARDPDALAFPAVRQQPKHSLRNAPSLRQTGDMPSP